MPEATLFPLKLAREALEVGSRSLPLYSSKYARHDFTQPQLFAVLVLLGFLRLKYRKTKAVLADWSDLREALGLAKVPDPTTLCKAHKRLLRLGMFRRLLSACFDRARRLGWIDGRAELSVDATGFESGHVSAHYRHRCGGAVGRKKRKWPKLTAVVHTATHLIAGTCTSRGPSQDSPQLPEALRQAAANVKPYRVLADKGYDAEHNHELARELGAKSTAIPLNPRNHAGLVPKTPHRRRMHRAFPRIKYRQRAQSESVFSRTKRTLGSALSTPTHHSQNREMRLLTFTHNLMILRPSGRRVSTEPACLTAENAEV